MLADPAGEKRSMPALHNLCPPKGRKRIRKRGFVFVVLGQVCKKPMRRGPLLNADSTLLRAFDSHPARPNALLAPGHGRNPRPSRPIAPQQLFPGQNRGFLDQIYGRIQGGTEKTAGRQIGPIGPQTPRD